MPTRGILRSRGIIAFFRAGMQVEPSLWSMADTVDLRIRPYKGDQCRKGTAVARSTCARPEHNSVEQPGAVELLIRLMSQAPSLLGTSRWLQIAHATAVGNCGRRGKLLRLFGRNRHWRAGDPTSMRSTPKGLIAPLNSRSEELLFELCSKKNGGPLTPARRTLGGTTKTPVEFLVRLRRRKLMVIGSTAR